MQYIALLRGINVGGNHIIRMADLKACFMEMGFQDVRTYIQSGNVLFYTNSSQKPPQIADTIEKNLSSQFDYTSQVMLVSHDHMKKVVAGAPSGFGQQPDLYRYDVLFLKTPLTAAKALKDIQLRENIDNAQGGDGVVYFSRLISKAGQSYLNKLIPLPVYQQMTIRNWNTTSKLLALAGA